MADQAKKKALALVRREAWMAGRDAAADALRLWQQGFDGYVSRALLDGVEKKIRALSPPEED